MCDFDYVATYGPRGEDYIEVHHIVPLHLTGQRDVSLDELILLCANCHRMIHRNPLVDPAELRELVLSNRTRTSTD